eukprot:scaffold364_cov401-Prasinococcus_capsulatus_cf.AAC.5
MPTCRHMYTVTVYPALADKPAGYKVYIDGRLAGIGFDVGGNAFNPQGNIYLCGRSDADEDRYYGGRIAYLSIYDAILSGQEVLAKAIQESIDQLTILSPPAPIVSCEANGWHTDCNGKCFAEVYMEWVGDSICDEGAYGNGKPDAGIDLNCASYDSDGGDCPGSSPVPPPLPDPVAFFPFNEGAGNSATLSACNGYGGLVNGAEWVHDPAWQSATGDEWVLHCTKTEEDQIVLDDIPYYGELDGFTLNFWIRNPSSPGFLFEYIFSHGSDEETPELGPFSPNNLHIYTPEENHPAYGIIRTILVDGDDGDSGFYYLDSDGEVSNNSPRDAPGHVKIDDDKWHMFTVVATFKQGYQVYVDGRYSGTGTNGDSDFDPIGSVYLCGRSDEEPSRHFDGRIASMSMYDTALSQTQILKLYEDIDSKMCTDCYAPEPPFSLYPPGRASRVCVCAAMEFEIQDCNGQCLSEFYLEWLGDGICDYGISGQTIDFTKINFFCSEYKYDEGDCDSTIAATDYDGLGNYVKSQGALTTVPDPVALFKLNEADSSTSAHSDASTGGEQYTGSLVNGAKFQFDDDLKANALKCFGTDSRVDLQDIPYGDTGGFAVNFFFKTGPGVGSSFQKLLVHTSGDGTQPGPNSLFVELLEDAFQSVPNLMRTILLDSNDDESDYSWVDSDSKIDSNSERVVPGSVDLVDNAWHMFTVVGRPKTPYLDPGHAIYVDGRLSGKVTNVGGDLFDPSGQPYLCSTPNDADHTYAGLISELSFYGTELTDAQVFKLYIDTWNTLFGSYPLPAANSPPADCGEYYLTDCDGKCFAPIYTTWIGNQVCDSGESIYPNGQSINLECDTYENDSGDCPSSSPQIPQAKIFFPMNEGKGPITTANTDSSTDKTSYVGVAKSATWVYDDVFGDNVIECPGAVAFGDLPYYGGENGFSFSFWFRNMDLTGDSFATIYNHGFDASSPQNPYLALSMAEDGNKLKGLLQMAYKPGSGEIPPNVLSSDGQINNEDARNIPGHVPLDNDMWHMVTVVVVPASGSGTVEGESFLYIDGKYTGDAQYSASSAFAPTSGLKLCGSDSTYNGRVSSLSFYDAPLSALQVYSLFQAKAVTLALNTTFPPAPSLYHMPPPAPGIPFDPKLHGSCGVTDWQDCQGNCVDPYFLKWVGDGICDASQSGSVGVVDPETSKGGIDFSCSDWGYDSSDCVPGLTTFEQISQLSEQFTDVLPSSSQIAYFEVTSSDTDFVVGQDATGDKLGQIHNGEVVTDGVTQQSAIQCDKYKGTYVTIDNLSYTSTGAFTVTFWFRTQNVFASDDQYLYSHGNGAADPQEAQWLPNSLNVYIPEISQYAHGVVRSVLNDYNDNNGVVEFYWVDSDGEISNESPRNIEGHVNIQDEQWHMYAMVATTGNAGAEAEKGFSVYIDGRLVGAGKHGGDQFDPGSANNVVLCGRSDYTNSFSGYMKKIGFYSISASPEQIFSQFLKETAELFPAASMSPPPPPFTCEEQGFHTDCAGHCFIDPYLQWQSDGICDFGIYGGPYTDGEGIDLASCPLYNFDGNDCDKPEPTPDQYVLPAAQAYFPLNEGSGFVVQSTEGNGYGGSVNGAEWVQDNVWKSSSSDAGNVLHCTKDELDFVLLPDIAYSGTSGFTISFWFRNPDSPGNLFEYIFSHGTADVTDPLSNWEANEIQIYMPEEDHPSHGVLRTIVKSGADTLNDAYYLDTDGQITNNFARDSPGHVNIQDDKWHMYTLVQAYEESVKVFVDGRYSGVMTEGLEVVDPSGQIHLCGRGDGEQERHFGGKIADLYIFSSALSNLQVWGIWHTRAAQLCSGVGNQDCWTQDLPQPPTPPLPSSTAECPDGQFADCSGSCISQFYLQWIGDGLCDAGISGSADNGAINFACDKYNFDNSDCDPNSDQNELFLGAYEDGLTHSLPPPLAYFEFNEGTGASVQSKPVGTSVTATISGATWYTDESLGRSVLECHKEASGDADDFQVQISDFDYTTAGAFAVSFWFRNPSGEGTVHEYMYSHGDLSGAFGAFGPNVLNAYIPEDDHPANGVVRTILNDENDANGEEYYVDTDGQISNNGARDVSGHINTDDDLWHLYTVVANSEGFLVFLDGRFAGKGTHGGDDFNPTGSIFMCGRSDQDANRNFGGYIAELSFFNKALTTADVWSLFVQGRNALVAFSPPPPPSGKCEDSLYHTDCDGACFGEIFLQWVGDQICDDGSNGLNLNCAAYNGDGGDCASKCTPVGIPWLRLTQRSDNEPLCGGRYTNVHCEGSICVVLSERGGWRFRELR